jgi:putative sigma-54 modulation protein
MQLQITGKSFEVTPALKSHAEEKFQTLQKRFNKISTVHLVLYLENITQIAEANLVLNANEFHAKAEKEDMYEAIAALVEKLSNQLLKYKEKLIDSHH